MNLLKYLVVMALIGFTSRVSADESADWKTCLAQLKQLSKLTIDFVSSHNGRYPNSFDELLSVQKTPDATILVAPFATDKSKPSYELVMPGKELSRIINPSRTVAIRPLYTVKDKEGRQLVAFADGHVSYLEEKKP